MAPLSCNPEDTNSWANTAQTLPTQPWSLVGLAARRLRRTPACPPRPLCLLDATRVVPDDGAGRYHRACEEEMAIVQEAHASVHRLTILPDDEDRLSVDRLCRAEEAELMAALGHYENGRGKPSGVRPPRAAALTVLVEPAYNTHEKKHAALVLDAAAFLARVGDSDGERLVSSVRVSALFRDHARKYQAEHPSSSMKPVRGQVSVCLSWVVEDPTCFEYEHGGYMESSHAEIAQCDTAKAYVEAIRNAAASLMPECTRATSLGCRALAALSRSVDLARSPVENAQEDQRGRAPARLVRWRRHALLDGRLPQAGAQAPAGRAAAAAHERTRLPRPAAAQARPGGRGVHLLRQGDRQGASR